MARSMYSAALAALFGILAWLETTPRMDNQQTSDFICMSVVQFRATGGYHADRDHDRCSTRATNVSSQAYMYRRPHSSKRASSTGRRSNGLNMSPT